MGVVAQRVFHPFYILLDSIFLVVLCVLLFWKKRYLTLLFGLFGGVLYFFVDYVIFHLICDARSIEGANLFGTLLWMSMSYGITNFVLIWAALAKDKFLKEWVLLVVVWWISCPMLTQTFAAVLPGFSDMPPIKIQRTTASYHGYMAIFLFFSYAALFVYNLFQKENAKRFRVGRLLAIGILVQFGWEFSLLVGGIRSAEFATFESKIMVLVINSLVETNMGLPLIYLIYLALTARVREDGMVLKPRMTLVDRLALNNAESVVRKRIACGECFEPRIPSQPLDTECSDVGHALKNAQTVSDQTTNDER